MGRKTKLAPERQDKIVTAIRAGNYIREAAGFAGIGERTFYDWMERGEKAEDEDDIYAQFSQAVKKAEQEWEVSTVARINRAASEHWQAGMTMLERRHPERWGRRDRHDVKHSGTVHYRDLKLVPLPDEVESE